MKKPNKPDHVSTTSYKATVIPLIITIFFYWIALAIYVVYLYVTKGTLGIPFYLLSIGAIIYGLSNLIYSRKLGR